MGHVIAGSEWRWPNGVIPYTIMRQWSTRTNVTVRARQPSDAGNSYVEFVAGDETTSCSSPVSRQRGPFGLPRRQEVQCNLTVRPARKLPVLIHEIGHAVGVFHEHQRDDRHFHVTVLAENAVAAMRHNFDKEGDRGDDIGAYDFASVMHYSEQTFAVDWLNGATIPCNEAASGLSSRV
jgi:hypothetical protein